MKKYLLKHDLNLKNNSQVTFGDKYYEVVNDNFDKTILANSEFVLKRTALTPSYDGTTAYINPDCYVLVDTKTNEEISIKFENLNEHMCEIF